MNPRSVFERLFGTVDPSLDPATRARRALYRRSMLDLTRDDAQEAGTRSRAGRSPPHG